MMEKDRVAHMLALGKKKREGAIEAAELELLEALRQEYLSDFREGFRQRLENIYVEQEDGSYQKLQRKKPEDR